MFALLTFLLICQLLSTNSASARIKSRAAETLRLQGYRVKELDVPTKDGIVLKLVQAENELFRRKKDDSSKEPILFVHGTLADANTWNLLRGASTKPKDLSSKLNLTTAESRQASLRQLSKLIHAHSLPSLALSFGHPIYLLYRRGFHGSRREKQADNDGKWRLNGQSVGRSSSSADPKKFEKVVELLHEVYANVTSSMEAFRYQLEDDTTDDPMNDLLGPYISALGNLVRDRELTAELMSSMDREFWDFSLDQQAADDIPAVIRFICRRAKREKIAYVGHSAGGALLLMALAEDPQLSANVSKAVLWAPSFHLGDGRTVQLAQPLEPYLRRFFGPVPPKIFVTLLRSIATYVCSDRKSAYGVCKAFSDLLNGPSGSEAPVSYRYIDDIFEPTGAREIAHLLQAAQRGEKGMHKFEADDEDERQPQFRSAAYQLDRINLSGISFYVGASDHLVTKKDIGATVEKLSVDYSLKILKAPFNHLGFFQSLKNPVNVILPSYMDLIGEEYDEIE